MTTNQSGDDFTPEAVAKLKAAFDRSVQAAKDGDTEASEAAMVEFRALAHDPQNYL